jgi:hypothetical protein
VNGKDHGGALEMTWVSDDRNRLTTPLNNMAGGAPCGIQPIKGYAILYRLNHCRRLQLISCDALSAQKVHS